MAIGKYQKWLEPDNLILLEAWARNGLTDEQIAKNIGISKQTFYIWKKKYTDFSDALKKGKEIVDIQVENSLLKRALGYEYEEISEKFEMGILTERKVTKKQVVPDTTAQIFWLKNRKPEEWRDKRDAESKVELETDGFMNALKGKINEVFKEGDNLVET